MSNFYVLDLKYRLFCVLVRYLTLQSCYFVLSHLTFWEINAKISVSFTETLQLKLLAGVAKILIFMCTRRRLFGGKMISLWKNYFLKLVIGIT